MTTPHSWAITFFVSAAVAALVVSVAAHRSGSRRRGRGRHHPLGGATGLAAGVLLSIPFILDADRPLVVGVVGALGLFVAGELTDRRIISWRVQSLATLAAGVAVVAAGLRLPLAGFDAGNAALTVLVICGASAAWRPGPRRDPQLLAWAVLISASAGALGGLAGQAALAAACAAVAGSAIGVLVWSRSPGSARLGSSGSVLLGYLTAVLAINARPALGAPRDAAIPLILLALPLVDATLSLTARVRGQERVVEAGLPGRLGALGLSDGAVSLLLVTLEGVVAVLALFAGRAVWPLAIAGAVTGVGVAALVVGGLLARAPRGSARWSGPAAGVLAAVVVAVVVLSVPAGIALLRGRAAANAGAGAALVGLAAVQRGDTQTAASAFAIAQADFTKARQRLMNPLASGGLVVPVLAPNLDAARKLSALGLKLSQVGHQLATNADPQRLRVRDGTVNLAELARLDPQLQSVASSLAQASRDLDDIDRTFLVASVDDSIARLQRRLHKAAHDARIAASAATILQAVMGGDGPKRYLVAIENNAESRATGGFIGSWGILTAVNGKLSLGEVQPITALDATPGQQRVLHAPADYTARYARLFPQDSWSNINFSPDFPTVGAVAADLLPQSGAGRVDGVITIDPVGLASILDLTGPIMVPPWSGPITAQNVVDVTLQGAYVAFPDRTERQNFLGDVAKAAWEAFSRGDIGSPARVLRSLGQAAHTKHLAVWLADPRAERLVRDANVGAAVPAPRPSGDFSLVTTQNVEANKLDLYLRKRVQYVVHLTPRSGDNIGVAAQLKLTLENTSPPAGLPQEVLGPNPGFGSPGHGAGYNSSFVTVYSPLSAQHATLDGSPTTLNMLPELGYHANSTTVTLAPGATHTLAVELRGALRLGSGARYTLRIGRQPVAAPDNVTVIVDVPAGWRLSGGGALGADANGRTARYTVHLDRDRVLTIRLERNRGNSLWARLQDGPRR